MTHIWKFLSSGVCDRQFTYKIKSIRACVYRCCSWKAIRITYSQCVSVALIIQHVKLMRLLILKPVVCLPLPYFSTLSHKRHDCRERRHGIQNASFHCLYNFPLNVSHSKRNVGKYYHKYKMPLIIIIF